MYDAPYSLYSRQWHDLFVLMSLFIDVIKVALATEILELQTTCLMYIHIHIAIQVMWNGFKKYDYASVSFKCHHVHVFIAGISVRWMNYSILQYVVWIFFYQNIFCFLLMILGFEYGQSILFLWPSHSFDLTLEGYFS